MQKLPNFIIIGAMKAGTTSLYYAMIDHPLVKPARTKELHQLSQSHTIAKAYINHFPDCKENEITGEATPNYLIEKYAPKNAKRITPNAKFIALLRNPVERTFSQYWGYVRKSRRRNNMPRCKNFEEYYKYLIDNPNNNQGRVNYVGKWGIKRSLYAEQLERWYKEFSKKQIIVIKSEDMFKDINKITNQIYKKLSLPYHKLSKEFHYLERRYQNRKWGIRTVPIRKKDKEYLKEYFKPFNKKLYKLIKRDMKWEKE